MGSLGTAELCTLLAWSAAYTMHVGAIVGFYSVDPLGRASCASCVLVQDINLNPLGDVQVDVSINSPAGVPYLRSRMTKPSGNARLVCFGMRRQPLGWQLLRGDAWARGLSTYDPRDDDDYLPAMG